MEHPQVLCSFMAPSQKLLEGIVARGKQYGWQMEFGSNGELPSGWYGDGIICDYQTKRELSRLKNADKLKIVTRNQVPGGNIGTVMPNQWEAARLVKEYFARLGFERLSIVCLRYYDYDVCGCPISPARALQEVYSREGIPIECLVLHNKTRESSYGQMMTRLRRFLAASSHPKAIYCSTPTTSAMIYRAAMAEGLRVPEDIAILSNTEQTEELAYGNFTFSYVSGEHIVLGQRMAETLQSMLQGNPPPARPVLVAPSSIVSAASTDILAVPDSRLLEAVRFLRKHYMEAGVAQAARHAGLSVSMLQQLTKKHLRTSIGQILVELKLNRVRQLLERTDDSLNRIAKQTGYSSAVSLSLAFKHAHNGLTPGAYRERHGHSSPQ
ncbi:MAG: substrate-binding domain-containing protein [Victivallales bacterium]|nr:substrate-binding domain-containing protein [Victivallales bacterium]